MADTVVMPRLGMTMLEGTVAKWLRPDGSEVRKGELILQVETDKIVHEVEAPRDGFLKHAAGENEIVGIGRPLAFILAAGESPPEIKRPAVSRGLIAIPAPAARIERVAAGAASTMRATPVAKRMAAESAIALETIRGTGPGGRITEADVKAAIAQRPAADGRAVKERIPLVGVKAATARHMQAAAAVPQVTLNRKCEAGALVRAREKLVSREAALGVRVSYNAILAKVLAEGLREHSRLNAAVVDGSISVYSQVNIGVAVNADRGLFVPVLQDAGRRPLLELATDLERLVARAMEGSLTLAELSGGTATITNLGAFGVDFFNPILNAPESVILGVGRIRAAPKKKAQVWLSLSFDHRVADGAAAAILLDHLAGLIDDPAYLDGLG